MKLLTKLTRFLKHSESEEYDVEIKVVVRDVKLDPYGAGRVLGEAYVVVTMRRVKFELETPFRDGRVDTDLFYTIVGDLLGEAAVRRVKASGYLSTAGWFSGSVQELHNRLSKYLYE